MVSDIKNYLDKFNRTSSINDVKNSAIDINIAAAKISTETEKYNKLYRDYRNNIEGKVSDAAETKAANAVNNQIKYVSSLNEDLKDKLNSYIDSANKLGANTKDLKDYSNNGNALPSIVADKVTKISDSLVATTITKPTTTNSTVDTKINTTTTVDTKTATVVTKTAETTTQKIDTPKVAEVKDTSKDSQMQSLTEVKDASTDTTTDYINYDAVTGLNALDGYSLKSINGLTNDTANTNTNSVSEDAKKETEREKKESDDKLKTIATKAVSSKPTKASSETSKKRGMYDHYFTASDCTVSIRNPLLDLELDIDKAISIGWNQGVSSNPIYTLGNTDPAFFSRGNSLVQGSIDIAFKSIDYMQNAFNYLVGKHEADRLKNQLNNKHTLDSVEEAFLLISLNNLDETSIDTPSLSNIDTPLELTINFDNNTYGTHTGSTSSLVIYGVKFIGTGMSIHSGNEQSLIQRFSFMAKNVR